MNIIYHLDVTRYPNLASFRYRASIPGTVLARRSYGVRVMHEGTYREGEPQVHIFMKHFQPLDRKVAKRMAFDKHAVIFDICDDHFDKPSAEYYREMCHTAHTITCNSQVMADRIRDETGREAIIIPDPYELPEATAVAPRTEPQLLWFGHPVNFNTLQPLLDLPYALELVTAPLVPFPLRDNQRVIEYSIPALLEAFQRADLVVLPTLDRLTKRAKSANRVIESLRQGRFVVAGPHIPAFEEFRPFIWLGDLREGIDYAIHHPEDVYARIRAGQDYIRERFSPETIADQWERVCHKTSLGVRHQDSAGVDQRGHQGVEGRSATGSH